MSTHTELVKKCMMSFGVWNAWAKNDAQKKLVVIGAYMLQTENVHFVCSMLYVVFLICLSVKSVLNIGPLISPEIDNAVWKAFQVYVAYTTMMMRYKKTEVTIDDTLKMILKIYKLDKQEKEMDENKVGDVENNHNES